jgi:hypothetical protein
MMPGSLICDLFLQTLCARSSPEAVFVVLMRTSVAYGYACSFVFCQISVQEPEIMEV